MADQGKKQQQRVSSKTTVNTAKTRSSKTTITTEATTNSTKSLNKNVQKKKGSNGQEQEKKTEKTPPMNQNIFDVILKVNKNKLRVLEKLDFFGGMRDTDLQIDVNEDFVVLKGKTQQIIDEARYKIDKRFKEVVTRMDNLGNLSTKFLRKPEVADYVNFMLAHERIPCSWEVNDKIFDLLVFSSNPDYAVEGSTIIKNCIHKEEIKNEQMEFEELRGFLVDNKKVLVVPRKKRGDNILLMTTDEFVKYQRIFNGSPERDDGVIQIIKVPLLPWKIEYFKKFSELKLKGLCNLYKVDHIIFEDHIELHGKDPIIVKFEIEKMANELFISFQHAFGNAPRLTKPVETKCIELEKEKCLMISIENKAQPHSGWLGNRRDAMMHIITMVGPVETCECDVLICPVMTDLQPFGCVKDVFKIGGKSVDKDITKLLKDSEETGTVIEPQEIVVIQNTGNLKCQLLLLTVIPPWGQKKDVILSYLYNSARRIINIVAETGYRSIGIPLDIADDFPSTMYATVLINNFWKLRKKFGHFVHIFGYADTITTVEDIEDFLLSEIIILGHMSRITFDKHLTHKAKQTSELTVNIVEGSIIDMDDKVDVIVNATNYKDLEYNIVSRKLVEKAGRDIIVPEYLEAYPNGIDVCDVAVTQPGNLKCQNIFHGCLFGWIMNGDLSEEMLKLFVTRCLREAESRKYTSIAFPAFGSSLLVFPPVLVAKVMFKAVEKFGMTEHPEHLKHVEFVLNPYEKEVAEVFENVQDWMVTKNNKLSTYDLPPKHIRCIHKKHGIRFMVAMTDHYKELKYKEVKVNFMFVSKEKNVEAADPVWDVASGSYVVTIKAVRTEKFLLEAIQKMVNIMEKRRFHVIDIFLLGGRDSGIFRDTVGSSFGPWTDDQTTKQTSGLSLQKQIDLIMTTILKNTDKIYDASKKSDSNLSYIRVVRMFASTSDFQEMTKKLKKGGIEEGHGETSSWHIYEKKPVVYKYHIQAIGKRIEAEMVLDELKSVVANMEIPKKVTLKMIPPVKKVRRKIEHLNKIGYHIKLDEAGKKAVVEGTAKEVQDIRKDLEDFIDNTLNVNLSEDDYCALIHFGKKESWFKHVESNQYEKGTLILTLKKAHDPDLVLKNVKNKMEEIRKMSECDVTLQKKMALFLGDIEREVEQSVRGISCYLSFNKKRIVIKAPNVKKAYEAKYLIQVKIGTVVPVRKQSKEVTGEPESKNGRQFTTKEGIHILAYPAGFYNLKANCLVSPAEQNLKHTKGIALSIAQAAGAKLIKECEEYLLQKGDLIVGTCCSTTAGSLPYHCIIHTFGPQWHTYGEEKKKCLVDLKAAIVSALHEANAHKHKSVAFTAIGSGHFGIPKPFCAIQYYKGVEEFGKHMDTEENHIKEVHFIDEDEKMSLSVQKTFRKYLGEGVPI